MAISLPLWVGLLLIFWLSLRFLSSPKSRLQCSWKELPGDIIHYISTFFDLRDLLNFRSVCKSWRDAATNQCPSDPQLLMLINNPRVVGVAQRKIFRVNLDSLGRGRCVGSAFGWLIIQRTHEKYLELSLENLFSGSVIEVPPLNYRHTYGDVYLSSPPASHNCTVLVALFKGGFALLKLSDNRWEINRDANWIPGTRTKDYIEHAVALQDKFYCLTDLGKLVSIEVGNNAVVIISSEEIHVGKRKSSLFSWDYRYMVEADGKILVVIVWVFYSKLLDVEVFRFDFDSSEWIKLESLDDQTLFVGYHSSFSVAAGLISPRGNYVYIANYDDNGWNVFDMESKRVLEGAQGDWPLTQLNSHRFWILPRL